LILSIGLDICASGASNRALMCLEAVLPKEVIAHLAGLMDSEGKTLAVLRRALSTIWQSPTMWPHCDNEVKYAVANFLLLYFPKGNRKSAPATDEFLRERGIILRRVEEYGFPHALRVTIGTDEENRVVLDALSSFMGANGATRR
jgi:histidinol-phosphate/aromatic aminotransferase/cobyric acid decarboxylase-like protein